MRLLRKAARLMRGRWAGPTQAEASDLAIPGQVASPWFIGLATDRAFVGPSCAMISSLDDNGDVPEAIVLVADFGLDKNDREALRFSAGRLGERMRFVPLSSESPKIVARPSFSFPWPLVGRFVLPGEIEVAGARLLLIDSDMIVNTSLRPLLEINMRGHPIGAIRDPTQSPDYFNAGLMLIEVDTFNRRGIGAAAMRRLAAYPQRPTFLDQDALNDVISGDWLRLDRTWNFFYAADPLKFELADYEQAAITHFAGPKPWEDFGVTPVSLYERHALRAQSKQPWLKPAANDLAYCKPALSSSTCYWSRVNDREQDARGANGYLLAATYGFHTDEEESPWWRVDLLETCSVTGVAIVNRPTHAERFHAFVIEASMDSEHWSLEYLKDDQEQVSSDLTSPLMVDFPALVITRYIRIRSLIRAPLHLRRVQVFGSILQCDTDQPESFSRSALEQEA